MNKNSNQTGSFRTPFPPKSYATPEVNDEPSLTIPDQSLSMRTLFLNHTRGLPMQVQEREGQYFGKTLIPRFEDITDYHSYKKELEYQLSQMNEKIKGEQIEAQEKAKAEAEKLKPQGPPPSAAAPSAGGTTPTAS